MPKKATSGKLIDDKSAKKAPGNRITTFLRVTGLGLKNYK